MLITILASIGSQNLGDELILKNEIKLLEKRYENKDVTFYVFSYDHKNPFFTKQNVVYLEYPGIGKKNPFNIFKNIRNYLKFRDVIYQSDLVVIGGGGIIYDNEVQSSFNPLNAWTKRVNLIKRLGKKILFFSIGINISHPKNEKKLQKIFVEGSEVVVRDNSSLELLENLEIPVKRSYDPVFMDKKLPSELSKISHFINFSGGSFALKKTNTELFDEQILQGLKIKDKRVGIAFRSGYIKNETEVISNIISRMRSLGAHVVLMPHSFHKTDNRANDYIFLKKFVGEGVDICENMHQVYEVYKGEYIDLCFAMRLHSMILSQVYEIPFIGISYSKKTEELLREL